MKRICSLLPLAALALALAAAPAAAQQDAPADSAAADTAAADAAAVDTAAAVVDTTAQVEAARAAAETWLGFFDAADYEQSWTEAAALFKQQITSSEWSAEGERVAAQIGALEERTFADARYTTSLPQVSEGEYVTIVYDAQYAGMGVAQEVIVMTRENESWKTAFYVVRPPQAGGS